MISIKIKSITKIKEKTDTYDIEIKTNDNNKRNFIANDIIVHNSNGIEPSFMHHYKRNIIEEGKSTKKQVDVYSYEFLKYRKLIDPNATIDNLPDYFVTANSISPKMHIDMQAAAQKWIDSSISKCIAKGTRILTNVGLVPIEKIGYASIDYPGEFRTVHPNITHVLCPDNNWRKIKQHYCDGKNPSIIVNFDNGIEIEGSLHHKLKTINGWTKLSQLKVGDHILCRKGVQNISPGNYDLPTIDVKYEWANKFKQPTQVTSHFAKFIGMQLADGHLQESSGHIGLSNKNWEIIDEYSNLVFMLFGIKTKNIVDPITDVITTHFTSRAIVRWLIDLCGYDKKIPEQIMRGNQDELLALLSGISLGGYKVQQGSTEYTVIYDGRSKELADQIFSICFSLGFYPYKGKKYVSSHDYYVYNTRVNNFNNCIQKHKNSVGERPKVLVPIPEELYNLKLKANHKSYSWLRNIKQIKGKQHTCSSLILEDLNIQHDSDVYCIKVTNIDYSENELYDIEVEDSHDYLIDGVFSHNTINCATDIPFEEFKDLYMYAYQKGCKGLTTYRPSSNIGQVLVDPEHQKSKQYTFELENGEVITVSGDEIIEYEGEQHTASLLAEALRENQFGKF
ncbi:MAG: hypothetical protein H8D97_01620 [Proteobacteria bacterium]|nr:hypothetical protein [Pseudomonadota bacterium]